MSEPVVIQCPSCSADLRVKPEYAGKKVACKHCQHAFTVVIPAASANPSPATIEAATEQLQRDKEKLLKAASRLQAELNAARGEVETLGQELAKQRESIVATQSECESLRAEAERVRQDLREHTERAEEEIRTLRVAVAQLEQEKAESGTRDEAAASAQAECERLQQELSRHAEESEGLRHDLDALKGTLASLEGERDQLREQAAAAREQLQGLDETAARLRSLEEERDAIRAERDRHSSALMEAQAESQRLSEELQGTSARLVTFETEHRGELERLQAEAESQRGGWAAEREKLVADWELKARAGLDDAERLQREVESLRSQLDAASAEHAQVVGDLREESSRYAGESSVLRTQLDALQSELEEFRNQSNRQVEEQSLTEVPHESHLAELHQLQSECASLRERTKELEREVESRDAEISAVRSQLNEATSAPRAAAATDPFDSVMAEWSTGDASASSMSAHATAAQSDEATDAGSRHNTPVIAPLSNDTASDLARLEAELTATRREIDLLQSQLTEANNWRKQIQSFLRGLGIRLPG